MERRTGTYRWAIAMVVVGCLVLSSPSAHAAASVHNHAQDLSTSDDQAIDLTRADETVRQETATTDDLTAQFTAAYRSAKPEERRALYDHYLDRLGAPALLDVLEDTHRFCHREGHPLGHAIFAQSQDLAMALRVCGNRCNKGCSHGVLEAAFGDSSFQTIATEMEQFCHQDNVTQIHGPGNCAHAVGHALFKSADHDAEQALTACAALAHPGMGYYCATGVFMEYYDRTRTQKMSRPRSQNLHFPCDTLRYPAACYRYEAWRMLRAPGYNLQVLARECLSLSGARRLGCFHGLGFSQIFRILRQPTLLPDACTFGSPDDQAVCIEGAIEKLADFDEQKALAACAALTGENVGICQAAAKEKMYRVNKPTMPLYSGEGGL